MFVGTIILLFRKQIKTTHVKYEGQMFDQWMDSPNATLDRINVRRDQNA